MKILTTIKSYYNLWKYSQENWRNHIFHLHCSNP